MENVAKTIADNTYKLEKMIKRYQFLTGNMIKILAISIMFIDHFSKIILQWFINNIWSQRYNLGEITWEEFQKIDSFVRFDLKGIGTIAFPLFVFLLSEGFIYTKNRKKYFFLLIAFAFVSELPFDLAFFGEYSRAEGTFPFYFKYQNVFFSLALGFLAVWISDTLRNTCYAFKHKIALTIGVIVLAAGAATILKTDYQGYGIILLAGFYFCRQQRLYQIVLYIIIYMLFTGNQPTIYVLLAAVIILFYNGKRGKQWSKYFFYSFYPLHLLVLYILKIILPYCYGI